MQPFDRRTPHLRLIIALSLSLIPALARAQESQPPSSPQPTTAASSPALTSPDVRALADAVRELQGQVQQLHAQMDQLRANERQAQAEARELRHELRLAIAPSPVSRRRGPPHS